MKKITAIVLALSLLMMGAAFADTLTMGTNAAFPPYEYYEEGVIVGIDAEIAAAICEKLGYDLEIIDMDFGNLISSVASGKIDFAMAGMTKTPEREESVNFTVTYAIGVQSVIVPEGSAITTIDDLYAEGNTYMIGVQQGTTGDIYCTDDFGDDHVAKYLTGADAVAALVAGKIDCVIIDNNPAKAFVEANEGLTILDTDYSEEEYAIAIALDNTDLLNSINAALEELIAEGVVDEIIAKYIPVE
ncbi:MAG: amino acid ABC transporter substrate-binding protein [Clostridia bacterium]|nr:amino acid ABC transporter substrate-binding protein [Clostridia bacterium]